MKRGLEHIEYNEYAEALANVAKVLVYPTHHHHKNQLYCLTGDSIDAFPLAQSAVSQHPEALKNAGLIRRGLKPKKNKIPSHSRKLNLNKIIVSAIFWLIFFNNHITNW